MQTKPQKPARPRRRSVGLVSPPQSPPLPHQNPEPLISEVRYLAPPHNFPSYTHPTHQCTTRICKNGMKPFNVLQAQKGKVHEKLLDVPVVVVVAHVGAEP